MTEDKIADRRCKRDGFPLVRINNRWECVAEYLDRCIGGQRIVDVVQRDEKIYYVFASGHELPLLCFCCSKALVVQDLGAERRYMRRRRLESMFVEPVPLEDGSEKLQFNLVLSKKLGEPASLAVPISTQSVVQMHHPPDCPYSKPGPRQSARGATPRRTKKR